MTDDDNKPFDDIGEFVETASNLLGGVEDFVDEHGSEIEKITGRGGSIDMGDDTLLNRVEKGEDDVEIAIEAEEKLADTLTIKNMGDAFRLSIGDEHVTTDVPSDSRIDDAMAIYNNGVLTVRIPRGGDEDGA